jgi:hypothetical protein
MLSRIDGINADIAAVDEQIEVQVVPFALLQDPDEPFHDLGTDHFSHRTKPDTSKRNHVHQLEALGYTVTLKPTRIPNPVKSRVACHSAWKASPWRAAGEARNLWMS